MGFAPLYPSYASGDNMDLIVESGGGEARWGPRRLRCAVGSGGIVRDKREGDGGTPAGRWQMREVLFRADRVPEIVTALPTRELLPTDGWCDDPYDPAYNRLVELPYRAHCEQLWLDDRVYDVIVPVGYNDNPVVPERGSAIFLHVARPDFTPTSGCVALALPDLLAVLRQLRPGAAMHVVA
jgi:L,D-peptidoglycan transpeptidase YkuD (ErfK/YbiS/YcfS/YnhG family)